MARRQYPHNIPAEQAAAAARMAAATARFPAHGPEWQVEVAILELQAIVRDGLPDCYRGFDADWQADFHSNFTDVEAIRLLLADPRLPAIAEELLRLDGYDPRAEITAD